jgi:hypothetical protein
LCIKLVIKPSLRLYISFPFIYVNRTTVICGTSAGSSFVSESISFLFSLARSFFYVLLPFWARSDVCRRAPIRFVVPVRSSVFPRASALFPLDQFPWNLILATLRKYAEELQIWLQSDKSIGHNTRRPEYVFTVDSGGRCSVPLQEHKESPILALTVLHCWHLPADQQQFKGKALLCFHNNSVYASVPLGTLYVPCLAYCIRCLICNPCSEHKTYFIFL